MLWAKAASLLTLVTLTFPGSTFATEPFDYAAQWNGWPDSMRLGYVEGYSDGLSHGSSLFAELLIQDRNSSEKIKSVATEISKITAIDDSIKQFETYKIMRVMDQLYADPSNSFVKRERVLLLAVASLNGGNVEELLRQARKQAILDRRIGECLSLTPADRSLSCLNGLGIETMK